MSINIIIKNFRRTINKIESVKNIIKFKLYGVQFGSKLCIHGTIGLSIEEGGNLVIGDNFYASNGNHINPLCSNKQGNIHIEPNAKLIIGNHVGMSSTVLWCHKSITIGNYVNIGANCIVLDSDCHSLGFMHRRTLNIDILHKNDAPIVIEDDVLIGMNCMILKGVTIGARSVIGAGSVVTKSIPADCIAAGNPARVIKQIQ